MVFNEKIAAILKDTEHPELIQKANALLDNSAQKNTLHLRALNLKQKNIITIAKVLKLEKDNETQHLKSISFSYNHLLGDVGATVLFNSLPESIREIGLVHCGIGDKGGIEILNWIRNAPHLRMICIEGNNFSEKLKNQFRAFQNKNTKILVVI